VEKGNTVVVIEHNLDVIKSSDYIIDLGPEGGKGGGKIIATGTPEEVAESLTSYTGKFLHKVLEPKLRPEFVKKILDGDKKKTYKFKDMKEFDKIIRKEKPEIKLKSINK